MNERKNLKISLYKDKLKKNKSHVTFIGKQKITANP